MHAVKLVVFTKLYQWLICVAEQVEQSTQSLAVARARRIWVATRELLDWGKIVLQSRFGYKPLHVRNIQNE